MLSVNRRVVIKIFRLIFVSYFVQIFYFVFIIQFCFVFGPNPIVLHCPSHSPIHACLLVENSCTSFPIFLGWHDYTVTQPPCTARIAMLPLAWKIFSPYIPSPYDYCTNAPITANRHPIQLANRDFSLLNLMLPKYTQKEREKKLWIFFGF